MHSLHVYKDYPPVMGGIEHYLSALAEGLAARGQRVTVLVTSTTPHDEVEQRGNLTIIKAARSLHLASTPLSPRMFWYARQLHDIDVVHLQFPYPPGDLAARLVPRQPPLVISYQSDIVRQRWLLRGYAPLLRGTLARSARICATSPAYIASSPWLQPHRDRCEVVPLSIDPAPFAQPRPAQVAALRQRYGEPLVLFVGRLRYYKGLSFLVEAMALLRAPARLLIVGTGPEEGRLQQQVQAAGLGERIHFLGDVAAADLPACYQAADVFVLPSHLRAEAFGIVQLEAQAAGLPVVCTELGTGTSYVTRHASTGLVVPPASPAALARALDVLLANPALARQMGAAGRARVMGEFTHPVMLDRIERIYQRVRSDRW